MISLFRELVPAPIMFSASTTITSRPLRASARAIASPMTPAPITRQSMESTETYCAWLEGTMSLRSPRNRGGAKGSGDAQAFDD
jgi:hypothetical protein